MRSGLSNSAAIFIALVVLVLGGLAGYLFGQNLPPSSSTNPNNVASPQKTPTLATSPTAVALKQFSSEKFALTFPYPDHWKEDVAGASLVGTEKVVTLKSEDFSQAKTNDIQGARLEVLKFIKKQSKETALEDATTFEGYEAVKRAKDTVTDEYTLRVWEYKIDPTNTEVYKDADPKKLHRVVALARLFVSETESYILNFEGRGEDELQQFEAVLTELKVTPVKTQENTNKKSSTTPTPLPTNATFFEGQ